MDGEESWEGGILHDKCNSPPWRFCRSVTPHIFACARSHTWNWSFTRPPCPLNGLSIGNLCVNWFQVRGLREEVLLDGCRESVVCRTDMSLTPHYGNSTLLKCIEIRFTFSPSKVHIINIKIPTINGYNGSKSLKIQLMDNWFRK